MKLSVRRAQRNEIDGTVRGTLDTSKLRKVSQVRHCAGGEMPLLENTVVRWMCQVSNVRKYLSV